MANVRIPEILDLSEIIINSEDPTARNPVYKLYGIINHIGSLNGGHYTAVCRNPFNNKWYNFNDSRVSQTSINFPIDSSSAYIVFYKKI